LAHKQRPEIVVVEVRRKFIFDQKCVTLGIFGELFVCSLIRRIE